MSREEITFAQAITLAESRARQVLRGRFPKNASDVFEKYIVEDKNFWLFFRNREIPVPEFPNGEVSDVCAFAVEKHGLVLTVKDNFNDKEKLEAQIKALSGHFPFEDK